LGGAVKWILTTALQMRCPHAPMLLAALAACSSGQAPDPANGSRPNVLLIVVDTLRADRVSS